MREWLGPGTLLGKAFMPAKVGAAVIVLMLLFLASLLVGAYKGISLGDLLAFIKGDLEGLEEGIVKYRLVRTLAALIVGAGLSASGLALQFVLRNPLADPYLLGVSAGAAFGVLLSYLLSYAPDPLLLYSIAFISGLGGFGLVLAISLFMSLTPTGLIVAGVSVSYVMAGLSMVLISRLIERIPMAYSWLFGTVAYAGSRELAYTLIAVSMSLGTIAVLARRINTLMLGEDVSKSMGVNPGTIRLLAAVASSLAASSIVAIAGPVGFLGLAGPWMARLLVGSSFTRAYPMAAMTGGLLALASDTTVRLIASPGEVPLTAITAFYGGPILFYLTLKSGRSL